MDTLGFVEIQSYFARTLCKKVYSINIATPLVLGRRKKMALRAVLFQM
jgi:hypothetical protein